MAAPGRATTTHVQTAEGLSGGAWPGADRGAPAWTVGSVLFVPATPLTRVNRPDVPGARAKCAHTGYGPTRQNCPNPDAS